MSWQLIETGPKDGTQVLLLDEHKRIRIGWFVDSEDFQYGKSVRKRQEWTSLTMMFGDPKYTHWMPLPATE